MKRGAFLLIAAAVIASVFAGCANGNGGMVSASPTAPVVTDGHVNSGNGSSVVPTIDPSGDAGGLGGAIDGIGNAIGSMMPSPDAGSPTVPGNDAGSTARPSTLPNG